MFHLICTHESIKKGIPRINPMQVIIGNIDEVSY